MKFLLNNIFRLIMVPVLLCTSTLMAQVTGPSPTRQQIVEAILSSGDPQKDLIRKLATADDVEVTRTILKEWKSSGVYVTNDPSGAKIPFILDGDKAIRIDNGQVFTPTEKTAVEPDSSLRKVINTSISLLEVSASDAKQRISAIGKLGKEQKPEYIPIFKARLAKETNSGVSRTLKEAIAITQLKDASAEVQIAALKELGTLNALSSKDMVKVIADDSSNAARQEAAKQTIISLDNHQFFIDVCGMLFAGLSNGAILLIAALGLAITFGLMGVINMAHGELIAVGAYSAYFMERWFTYAFGPSGVEYFFIFAIPFAFVNAALVGLILERTVIQFLYQRPLESLLATMGVSLIIQQLFTLYIGSNGVPVTCPSWLSGSLIINDVPFGYRYLFVIAFAALIIFCTWLTLTKTPMGLLVRAVMQNREMASCVGVRTQRVNMMTFAFGSGLAGLAGAFLSQLGNVGPRLGQTHIIDCFMTVVVGGVGNIIGTVCSAITIGITGQTLEKVLSDPVMGKITVLVAIILFLQFKPGGLFPTKGRGLED
ncbi:MAG: urea ABC transporter permease subunit UrtB [Candidatus Methylacidiphilales bacterium]|nr:urea ABC transporter permease subunit UrtB [Candidatus Methylacidiphilales bacterium]